MLWHSKNFNKKLVDFCSKEDIEMDKVLFPYAKEALLFHAKNHCKKNILSQDELSKVEKIIENISLNSFSTESEDIQTYLLEELKNKDALLYKKLRAFFSRNEHSLNTEIFFVNDSLEKINNALFEIKKELLFLYKNSMELPWLYQTHFRKGTISKAKYWVKAYIDWIDILVNNNNSIKLNLFYASGPGGGSSIYDNELSPLLSQHYRGVVQQTLLKSVVDTSSMLSKLSWDIILYSMLDHLELKFSFGSSAMPHKKNPDPLELIRANHFFIVSNLSSLYSIHNLPSGYHRDFQKGKEIMIKSFLALNDELEAAIEVVKNIDFNEKTLEELKSIPHLKSFETMSKKFLENAEEEEIYKKWQE